jgi:hypothetical protein
MTELAIYIAIFIGANCMMYYLEEKKYCYLPPQLPHGNQYAVPITASVLLEHNKTKLIDGHTERRSRVGITTTSCSGGRGFKYWLLGRLS